MKILVLIPARGGSKGIPKKNLKTLKNKPLIQYTLEAAFKAFDSENICVSTDDLEIKSFVEKMGFVVPFLRPAELALDKSSTYEVILHAIKYYEGQNYFPDTVVLLQATSPFRTAEHIKEALAIYSKGLDMVVSVKKTKSNPYFMLFEEDGEGFLKKSKKGAFTRRQDCPEVWEYNGAIYIINVDSLKKSTISEFKKIKKYEMDDLSSHDIDSILDWKIAELIVDLKL